VFVELASQVAYNMCARSSVDGSRSTYVGLELRELPRATRCAERTLPHWQRPESLA